MVSSVVEDHGDVDLLVNVSGYADPKPLFETDARSLEKTFRVNVFALTLMCREVAKNMRGHRHGKIVNIASTAGSTPRPGWISDVYKRQLVYFDGFQVRCCWRFFVADLYFKSCKPEAFTSRGLCLFGLLRGNFFSRCV